MYGSLWEANEDVMKGREPLPESKRGTASAEQQSTKVPAPKHCWSPCQRKKVLCLVQSLLPESCPLCGTGVNVTASFHCFGFAPFLFASTRVMRPARTFRSPPQCTSCHFNPLRLSSDLVKLRIWEQQARATRPPTHPPIQPEFTPQKDFLRQKNLKLTRVISIVL